MSTFTEIKNKRDDILEIVVNHGVNNIRVFGSVIKDEDTPDSDIDFLIDCKDDCSLFDLIELKYDLESTLNRKVDIVTEESVHWALKEKILGEAIAL